MTRSLWKYPHTSPKLEQLALHNKFKSALKTYERSATITLELIGAAIKVHNGNRFVTLNVTENHVGFKLGQFALTKKSVRHKNKKKKNKRT
jgi:small subunit ribosomal protein S19